jgi:mannose/fructose/N-acetylgalactosamine-specific phosphotransferase system component IID
MYLVAIAWIYVVLMMAVAEALSSQGTVLGAVFTFVLYGLLPLAIVLYILGTPGRRRARRAAEAAELAQLRAAAAATAVSAAPDGGGVAPGDAVAPVREER